MRDKILGQDRALDVLETALTSGKLPHALIFLGPPGVGKFTTAKALAEILLCPQKSPDLAGRWQACGSCPSCRLFRSDNHPDLHVIRKEMSLDSSVADLRKQKQRNIPIDLLRELVVGGTTRDGRYHEPTAYKTATLGHGKVFIIDEAELMDPYGQNALLKTLEEPAPNTFLILITSAEDRLLPTIRSRCQRVAFTTLLAEVVTRWLHDRHPELSPTQRDFAALFSSGSLGRAELAIRYNLDAWGQNILPALTGIPQGQVPADLGATVAEAIDQLAELLVKESKNASKEAANHLATGLMLGFLGDFFRRQLSESSARCQPDDPQASELALAPWLTAVDCLAMVQQELAANVNLGLVCDHLASLLGRCAADRALSLSALGANLPG
ncbi:MAG: DNA polymerase III subunit [Phycisphaeraceae bacterium]|nr:DNA polymerase III subunit [Phycisphaeraceae bacterium]